MLLHPAGAAGQAPEPMDIAGAAAATPDNAGSDPDGPATGAPRVLMIASRAEQEDSQRAAEAVESQLADLAIDLRVLWVETLAPGLREQLAATRALAAEQQAGIAFWVDVAVASEVLIYVAEPGGGRVLARSIDLGGHEDESRFETVALVVRGTVEALIEGGAIGVREPEPPAPPPGAPVEVQPEPVAPVAPVAAAPDGSNVEAGDGEPAPPPFPAGGMELAASYAASFYDGEPTVIHGGRLGAAWRLVGGFQLFVAYRFQAPVDKENSLVAMTLQPHPFEIGVAVRWAWDAWRLGLGVALLNDPVTWSVLPKQDTVHAESPQWRWLVGLSPGIAVSWSPYGSYAFFVSLGAEAYFNDGPSVVDTGAGQMGVVEPWPVRPYLQVGVEVVLL
jgi:hypothetical protein